MQIYQKCCLLLLPCIIFAHICTGQEQWYKNFTNISKSNLIYNVQIIPGQKLLISVPTFDTTTTNFLIKVDMNGNLINNIPFYKGHFSDIKLMKGSGFLVTGSESGTQYIARLDKDFKVQWENNFYKNMPWEGITTEYLSDSSILIAGLWGGITKCNYVGDTIWLKQTGAESGDVYRDIIEVNDGYILCGEKRVNTDPYAFIEKIDKNGNGLWDKSIGKGTLFSMTLKDSAIYVVGYANSYKKQVIKINKDGNILWQKDFPAQAINKYNDNLLISGNYNNSPPHLTSIDTSGNILWQKKYSTPDNFIVNGLYNSQFGYFITGFISTIDSNNNVNYSSYLLKTDSLGNLCYNADDCVWPGDADHNGVANAWDVLNIGLAHQDSGSIRPNSVSGWIGQESNDWSAFFSGGKNYKFADCDGNGVINYNDIDPIHENYGLVHSKALHTLRKISEDSLLSVHINEDSILAGSTVTGEIRTGASDLELYGIAMTISYTASLADSGTFKVDFSNSWLGTDSVDMITFSQDRYNDGVIDISLTRTDGQNKIGKGELASFNIIMMDDLSGKDIFKEFKMDITAVTAITNTQDTIWLTTKEDSAVVYQIQNLIDEVSQENIQLYPNPAGNKIHIYSGGSIHRITIFDPVGKEIYNEENITQQRRVINTSAWKSGLYFIKVRSGSRNYIKKIIIKNN